MKAMQDLSHRLTGTIAITDYGWYEQLRNQGEVEEVNFWKPSTRRFHSDEYSPFLFKLHAPHNAICGFGHFFRFTKLPDWLAWDCFEIRNGCASLAEMRERISEIRRRIHYKMVDGLTFIGCILVLKPVFFPRELWVDQPSDWPIRTQTTKRYDLTVGEGLRVWEECLDRERYLRGTANLVGATQIAEPQARYGEPILTRPRLGQGTFRVAVIDAYKRGCAFTGEHSLPALDAAHIRPYQNDGPNSVSNGLLIRADIHRLFDDGYITVTEDRRIEVSHRLREDYENGRSYYPLHGKELRPPVRADEYPSSEYLMWHNENVFRS